MGRGGEGGFWKQWGVVFLVEKNVALNYFRVFGEVLAIFFLDGFWCRPPPPSGQGGIFTGKVGRIFQRRIIIIMLFILLMKNWKTIDLVCVKM